MPNENTKKEALYRIRFDAIVCLLLAIATLAVYWQVRNHGFVSCDDPVYVTNNPCVRSGLTPQGIRCAFTRSPGGLWIPMTWLSLMVDHGLFGLSPGGYHLTNLLFHIVNIILLFVLLKRMTNALWKTAFVAALFALHPIHVESVAWVTERKDVLCTLFFMLTLLAYTRYVKRPDIKSYVLVFFLFALGLMAKPMLVTLPFVLLLLDYWPLGRFRFNPTANARGHEDSRPAIAYLVIEKLPLLFLSAAASVVTFCVQRSAGAIAPVEDISLGLRISNALVSYVTYIGKMFWPHRLAVLYPHPGNSLPSWQPVLACLLLLCVSILAVRRIHKSPYFLVGWLWYVGTLVPVSGISQAGNQAMADRFTYIPLIGLFIIIAWGVPDLFSRWRHKQIGLATMGVSLLFIFMLTTWLQARYWANSIILYGHTLDVTSDNQIAQFGLGAALSKQGRTADAITHYYEALRLNPYYAKAHNNLGLALAKQGRTADAITHYYEALRLDPHYAEAHNNLANGLVSMGKEDEAIAQYSEALRLNPRYAKAHNNLANVLLSQGKIDQAIFHYSEALRLAPHNAKIHTNLGTALLRSGKINEAIFHFREALRIRPVFPEAYYSLKKALAEKAKEQRH